MNVRVYNSFHLLSLIVNQILGCPEVALFKRFIGWSVT
jgi:hypothetical protein